MKKTIVRLVMVPVRVTVEHNEADGLYYASVASLIDEAHARPKTTTVRSGDKETAIHEALVSAGYGTQR